MTDLLVKPHPRDEEGCVLSVTPESAGWRHVGFAVFTLQPGERLERRLPERESWKGLTVHRPRYRVWPVIGARRTARDMAAALLPLFHYGGVVEAPGVQPDRRDVVQPAQVLHRQRVQVPDEFEIEMDPSISGLALFWEAITGATPALAPGTMLLFAALGYALIVSRPAPPASTHRG